MGESFQFLDIILFAMIAAFLILRLRSVLGRHKDTNEIHRENQRDGFSPEGGIGEKKESDENVVSLPDFKEDKEDSLSPLDVGLNQIRSVSPDFNESDFVDGAQAAFEMIIQAFSEGNVEVLETLLDNDVYNNFLQAIRRREAENQTLENTLVRIVSSEIIEAYTVDSLANVTLKIVSEQINVTRDKDGNVVEGDADHLSLVTDIWTFARDAGSKDPNWKLIATRSLD